MRDEHWRWPADYERLDQGRLHVRRDYLPIFARLGWLTTSAVMTTDRCQVVRRLAERENCRLELPRPGGGRIRAYLKRHWSQAVAPWLVARLAGSNYALPGLAEARAVGHCEQVGVPSMQVIAAGQALDRPPWKCRSFFLTEEIEGARPADDFWRDRMGPPGDPRSTEVERRQLLAELARTARRFHAAGLVHRDFYWCHFFVREPVRGAFEVHLIDLQRVTRPRLLRPRWLLKDLGQFVFSMPASSLSVQEQRFWFEQYLGVEQRNLRTRLWYELIQLRARLYHRKEGRR